MKAGYLLNDYCNRPTKTEPFCVIDSDVSQKAEFQYHRCYSLEYAANLSPPYLVF